MKGVENITLSDLGNERDDCPEEHYCVPVFDDANKPGYYQGFCCPSPGEIRPTCPVGEPHESSSPPDYGCSRCPVDYYCHRDAVSTDKTVSGPFSWGFFSPHYRSAVRSRVSRWKTSTTWDSATRWPTTETAVTSPPNASTRKAPMPPRNTLKFRRWSVSEVSVPAPQVSVMQMGNARGSCALSGCVESLRSTSRGS